MSHNEDRVSKLRKGFEQGLVTALDPNNTEALVKGGTARTTLSSPWLYEFCDVCGHTFRVGDQVFIDDHGQSRHFTPALPCAGTLEGEPTNSDEVREFFAGVDHTWPPPADVVRLTKGHRLLAPPVHGFKRHTCLVCGHTLRPQDQVVICPCSPNDAKCGVAVHQDPLHGLYCLSAWNPGGAHKHCPVTSRVLNED